MKGNFNELVSENRPVVVDFHAVWCGPCQTQSPILKEIAAEYGDKIRVLKIDVDQNNAVASAFNVRSVPTLMIFKNGEVKYQQAGLHTKANLREVINRFL